LRRSRARDGQPRQRRRFAIDYVAKEFLGVALARELGAALGGNASCCRAAREPGATCLMPFGLPARKLTEIVAYHTGGVGAAEPGVIEAIREARVDVVSFFSPSAVENLCAKLGAEVLSRLAARAFLAAVGPVTASALRKAGLHVAIEAPDATDESMAAAIVSIFHRPRRPK